VDEQDPLPEEDDVMRRLPRQLLFPALAVLCGLSPAAGTPLAVHIHGEKAMFQVLISPGAVGSDNFVLQLMSGEGTLLNIKEATLFLSLPGSGAAAIERKATPGSDGYWHVDDVAIISPGRWHIRIDAVTPFQKISLEDDFDVAAQ
jgi:copper transport protein